MIQSKHGILLTNLGTPDTPDVPGVRRYLKEFLWDRRVVDLPRWKWWLILNGIVLRTRPAKSAALYREVWTDEGSPLLVTARKQGRQLEAVLNQKGVDGAVEVGMRYGSPSIRSALAALTARGCKRLTILPLYPQYAGATTASTFDAVADVFREYQNIPPFKWIRDYYDHPLYIGALAESVRRYWSTHVKPDTLLFSFHGIPKRFVEMGDPYYSQCMETATQTAANLGLAESEWSVAFQSRFGKEEWLTPYTDKTLEAWPSAGVRSVHVLCPGFSVDCLETIQEIGMENRAIFLKAGGRDYHYIPALNDHPDHIAMMADLVMGTMDR